MFTGTHFDWEHLKKTVHIASRFLDNVIEMNTYPLPQIEAVTKNGNRKTGLGIMGWADLLIKMGIPYNSQEACNLAERIMKFIRHEARVTSRKLAEERGNFPNYRGSLFDDPSPNPDYAGEWAHQPQRNATVTTLAPTGTISIIAGASGGIEPLFAISFVRWQAGVEMVDVNPAFEALARERGFYSEELMREIAAKGTVHGVAGVPEDVQRVWVVSHDISPEWHVRMQAAWQRHCDNAVSKTCNFTHEATPKYVRDVYMLAYREGLKGVTVYRDGSRQEQVLNIGKVSYKDEKKAAPTVETVATPIVGHSSPVRDSGIKTNGGTHARSRDEVLSGRTHKMRVADKTVFVTVNKDREGIAEVFVNVGKSGSETDSLTEALGRTVSVSLRSGVAPEEIIEQLCGIRTAGTIVGQPTSIPDAVARALAIELGEKGKQTLNVISVKLNGNTLEDCPNAHQGCAVEFSEGCATCRTCGNSKCS